MSDVKAFIISRVVNAPRDLVWKVWTEKEHLMEWFGPKGWTMPKCEMDLQVGGTFLYGLENPDGMRLWGKWVFREIIPPEKIVMMNSFSDENRGITRHPMSDKWPLELLTTTTLADRGDKTEITIEWKPINASEEELAVFNSSHESMNQGWSGTFEQLETYLPSIQ